MCLKGLKLKVIVVTEVSIHYLAGVLLDANECSFGSCIPLEGDRHRYPCPYQLKLKQKFAEFRNIRKEQIFLGVGSSEAIDTVMRVFCKPARDSILITPPTFEMYKVINCDFLVQI